MIRLAVLLWLTGGALAADRWLVFRSGPFEVATDGPARDARLALNFLEQLRHALGQHIAKAEPTAAWPIRVLVTRSAREVRPPALARDAYTTAAPGKDFPRAWVKEMARLLLEENAGRMPESIENGLLDLYSTLQVEGTRVSLGSPPPAAERNLDWARLHWLATNPEYSGKLRALLNNLQQGMDPAPAFRNAFEKDPQTIEREAQAYLAAGRFASISISGRPIHPERDFRAREEDQDLGEVWLADLNPSRRAYEEILQRTPGRIEAREGLGLLGDREQLAAAAAGGSKNARVYFALGRLEEATKLNPRWAAPVFDMARVEPNAARKSELLGQAAALQPRNAAYWQALAEHELSTNRFAEASRAWRLAEQAAGDEQRAAIARARRDFEQRRADLEEAERRRIAEDKQRELQKLKDEALASIRAAEARANRDREPLPAATRIEQWWEGPTAAAKVRGRLQRVDCLAAGLRLVVQGDDGKPTQLRIKDPSQVVIEGGGEMNLHCGPQKPARRVAIDFSPGADARLGTAGDVAVIAFQ